MTLRFGLNMRPLTKPHRMNFRASDEQAELVDKIVHDLGLESKTEAIEHIFDTYEQALKMVSNR